MDEWYVWQLNFIVSANCVDLETEKEVFMDEREQLGSELNSWEILEKNELKQFSFSEMAGSVLKLKSNWEWGECTDDW